MTATANVRTLRHRLAGWAPSAGTRVNLASGMDYRPGWLNVDRYAQKADVRIDLTVFPWPLADASVDWMLIDQYLEHVPPVVVNGQDLLLSTLAEVHRVLKPGGRVLIGVPYAHSREDCYNIVHYRRFHPDSLDFLTDKGLDETGIQIGSHVRFREVAVRVHRRLRLGRLFDSWFHPLKWFGRVPNIGRRTQIVYLLEKA